MSRIFGIDTPIDSTAGKKEFAALAHEVLDKANPGNHNQSMMEFGALQCTPQNPACMFCPVNGTCVAFEKGRVQELPVKAKKIKQRERHFNYLVFRYQNQTWIQKREGKGIWQNLYEFPLIETVQPASVEVLTSTLEWKSWLGDQVPSINLVAEPFKHILTHQKIWARFWEVQMATPPMDFNGAFAIPTTELEKYAIPRLIDLFLEKYKW